MLMHSLTGDTRNTVLASAIFLIQSLSPWEGMLVQKILSSYDKTFLRVQFPDCKNFNVANAHD